MDRQDSHTLGRSGRTMTPSERRDSSSREDDAYLEAFVKETNTRKLAELGGGRGLNSGGGDGGANAVPVGGATAAASTLTRRGSAGPRPQNPAAAAVNPSTRTPPASARRTPTEVTLRPLSLGSASEVAAADDGFQRVMVPYPGGASSAAAQGPASVFADARVIERNYHNTAGAVGELSLENLIGPPGSPVPEAAEPGVNDDLMFEYEVLKRKLVEESAHSKQLQDKVHFLMLKNKAKDEQISNLRESLRAKTKMLHDKEAEVDATAATRDQLQRRVASLEASQMQLEYEKFQLQRPEQKRGPQEADDVVHQRGVEKTKLLVAHKLLQKTSDKTIEGLKVDIKKQRADYRRRLQRLEQHCMEFEDEYNAGTLHALMNTVKHGRYQQQRDARAAIARELRFGERVTFRTPDDEHVKALVDRSNYNELLGACKAELGDPTKELKELLDKTLQGLWLLFNEKQRAPQLTQHSKHQRSTRKIYDDFYKAIEQTLCRSKQIVAEYARKCNAFTKAMCAKEKEVTEHIRRTRYSTIDFECQTDFRPDTPKEIYDLRAEVKMYQERLRDLSLKAADKEQSMEVRASKAESNLEYLQRRILTLHRSLFNTLHLVYKHRYRWITRLPDPMRQLRIPEAKDRQKALEVAFNMKIGELLESDQKYMEAFGNYMVSDEYGTNAVGNTVTQTVKRRRSSQVDPNALAEAAEQQRERGGGSGGARGGANNGAPPMPGHARPGARDREPQPAQAFAAADEITAACLSPQAGPSAPMGGSGASSSGDDPSPRGMLRRISSSGNAGGSAAQFANAARPPDSPSDEAQVHPGSGAGVARANTLSKLPKAPQQPAPVARSDTGGLRMRRLSTHDPTAGDCPSPPSSYVKRDGDAFAVDAKAGGTALTSLPSFAQPIGRIKKRASVADASLQPCYVTSSTTAGIGADLTDAALISNLQIRKADAGRIIHSKY